MLPVTNISRHTIYTVIINYQLAGSKYNHALLAIKNLIINKNSLTDQLGLETHPIEIYQRRLKMMH